MKKTALFFILLINTIIAFTQTGVGIGNGITEVNSSAIVDMSKSNRGLLIPRLTQGKRLSINNPAESLILYDTTLDHTYLYKNGFWRYLLNNTYWSKSTVPNTKYVYCFDSVGIGTTSPDARLEVNANIKTRISLLADDNVIAGNLLKGDSLITNGDVLVTGDAGALNNIITQSSMLVNNANPIVQLKNGGTKEAFMQLSGDDFRIGTNSDNTSGKTIVRMDGADIISIDTSSGFKVLVGGSGGNINMGGKLTRQLAPSENMLPVVYGKVYDNNTQVWMSVVGSIYLTATGTYELEPQSGRAGARATILVTVAGTQPLTASAIYISGGTRTFKIEITNPLTGALTNADFSFIILDPLNL